MLELDEMMPAPCQGILGLELREGEQWILDILETIKHEASDIAARGERSFLQAVGGDCLAPLASRTDVKGEEISMEALLLAPDGSSEIRVKEIGPAEFVELVGAKLAGRLLYEGGAELFAQIDKQVLPYEG